MRRSPEPDAPSVSVAVMTTVRSPISLVVGVPLSVRVSASKLSHDGVPPSGRSVERMRTVSSTSTNASDGKVRLKG